MSHFPVFQSKIVRMNGEHILLEGNSISILSALFVINVLVKIKLLLFKIKQYVLIHLL